MNNNTYLGIGLTLLGAIFWGISGTCAQYLQVNQHINTEWLLTNRLLIAGILTVLYRFSRRGLAIFQIFTNKIDVIKLLIFGIFGIALCQYTYFRTIIYAGAGIATVIQYLAPVIIIFYLIIFYRKKPTIHEIVSVILATTGTALIAFQGNFSLEAIDGRVLFWGLLSALAVAIYSLQPVELLFKYGTGVVVGWGMIAGGLLSLFIWRPLDANAILDSVTYLNLFGVIFIGSVCAFNFYLEGVRLIGAVQGSVLSSIEPVSAAFFSWLLLHNHYSFYDMIGFILIITTIFILAFSRRKEDAKNK